MDRAEILDHGEIGVLGAMAAAKGRPAALARRSLIALGRYGGLTEGQAHRARNLALRLREASVEPDIDAAQRLMRAAQKRRPR